MLGPNKESVELWYGHPVNYNNMKVFGCIAYAHIKQDKQEPRARKCIFIGYSSGVKGYKLWGLEPDGQRCFMSRDVVFNETKMTNLLKYENKEVTSKDSDGTHVKLELQRHDETNIDTEALEEIQQGGTEE